MAEKKISQVEIARALNKEKSTINHWIKYDRIPPADYALRIADFLNEDLRYLITGKIRSDNLIFTQLQNNPKIQYLAEISMKLSASRVEDLLKMAELWLAEELKIKEKAEQIESE